MKKWSGHWPKLLTALAFAVLLVLVALMYQKLVVLTNRIAYLQDNTNIILSDISGLETNFAQMLKEETSLVEDFSIRIADMDFSAKSYRVEVCVIPKEYTDSTKLSVFFGTTECPLQKKGFEYTGSVTLPIGREFGGNLTFLFTNGKKKNTEVYSNYDGIGHHLEQVLSGVLDGEPKLRDGTLGLSGTISYRLDGAGLYEFDSLALVGELEDEELFFRELAAQPDGIDREEEIELDCGPERGGRLRVFLRAFSAEGYRFEYDLFRCVLTEETNEAGELTDFAADEESFDWMPSYVVYDRRGGKLVIK